MRAETKIRQTADAIRRQIVAGHWPPGAALPTVAELESRFPVSKLTLQRALGRLKEQQFIVTRPRQGMTVAARPPHLNRYGLLLGAHERHNRFWQILLEMSVELAARSGREFVIFRNLAHEDYAPDEWARLRGDIEEDRLAGLFHLFNPGQIPEIDWLRRRDLPQVSLNEYPFPRRLGVELDNRALLRRGLGWFATQGRRRVAFLARGDSRNPIFQTFCDLATADGRYCPPAWRLPLGLDAELATPVVELLMSLPPGERPNGLFIADDHLLEAATRGLIRARARVPEDVAVLSHCNWAAPAPCPLDVCRLGYDNLAILRAGVELIDAARQGDNDSRTVTIKPLFAEELEKPC